MSAAKQLERWDHRFVWHPFTQQAEWAKDSPLIVRSARGPYLWDIHGRRYLDGVSSLWVNVFGHRDRVLDRALREQLRQVAHTTFLGASHPPAIRLARELARAAPGGLSRAFFSDNGSTAVEVALKMAYQYWLQAPGLRPRREFLALENSYHGDTLGAVSVGGISLFHRLFKPLLFKTHFAMSPSCYRCPFNRRGQAHTVRLNRFSGLVPRPGRFRPETGCRWECLASAEKILKERGQRIAAAIIEPTNQAAAGMIVMPPGYLKGFERLCRRSGVLLIADEVATGFGRTGEVFACELEGVKPDLLCLAKSVTGGYLPLAATLATEKIYRAFLGRYEEFKTFFHGHTYTANPLASAVALAAVGRLTSRRFLRNIRQRARVLAEALEPLSSLPWVGSLRQVGLMAGIEIVQDRSRLAAYPPREKVGQRICRAARSRGVLLRPLGDCIVLMPPLVTSHSELRRLAGVVRWAIRETLDR
jgi:adenosylmethionine-8-amino-7-oxononanoate aminotransferase